MAKERIKIKKDDENPEATELLAKSIIQIAEGIEKINKGRLTRRAIVVLLQDMVGSSKLSKIQINLVLDNLPRLKAWYIKK